MSAKPGHLNKHVYLQELGADEVLDYTKDRLDTPERLRSFDAVINMVGGGPLLPLPVRACWGMHSYSPIPREGLVCSLLALDVVWRSQRRQVSTSCPYKGRQVELLFDYCQACSMTGSSCREDPGNKPESPQADWILRMHSWRNGA